MDANPIDQDKEAARKAILDAEAAIDAAQEAVEEIREGAGIEPASPSPEQIQRNKRTKLYAILVGVGLLVFFILLTIGLYALGDSDESSLERLRDIAVIYIVFISVLIVIVMAAATAALIYLIMQIKDQVIPLLEEINGTLIRVRGTTEFMTDQAVKPVINVSSKVAQWKAMARVATGREPK